MHYTGPTYRPPYEANSLLLQVTSGCSHNACTFCSMYRDVPFEASPIEEIEEDLRYVAQGFAPFNRVFLVNGDAFCLSADRLAEIAELIHLYLPHIESIGGYASINNVLSKSEDELRMLAGLGYADFNIGLESGLDDVLAYMNKGYTLAQAREALSRLNAAGMPFNLNIITAAAGKGRTVEHAEANAAIVNEANPTLIFVSPLHVDPGARLEQLVAEGDFEECTLGDYIDEEIEFLKRLEVSDCVFFGLHVSNPVRASGILPRDKDYLINELKLGREYYPKWRLQSVPAKGAEGRMVN
ncbi:MAG: radical SAM protein [Eggerthellaceae bacterium]|nr:radical SAM protein [Eggerthellaceae bacterium]